MGWFDRLLDKSFSWMIVPDSLPINPAVAVFCHTYSMRRDLTGLTDMGQQAMDLAIDLFLKGKAKYIILSIALYGASEERLEKRRRLFHFHPDLHVREDDLYCFLGGARHTHDEVQKVTDVLRGKGSSLIVVADRYHMRRSLQVFRRAIKWTDIYPVSSICRTYEMGYHPSLVRSLSIGRKSIHILWNIVLCYLTPIFTRKK